MHSSLLYYTSTTVSLNSPLSTNMRDINMKHYQQRLSICSI